MRGFAADLTRKRVRGHAVLLGLVLWGAYAINIATPGVMDREGQLKGADFLHFYVLGNIARLHDATMLYDAHRQADLATRLIHREPGESYLPVYGPQVSLLFLPLAGLSYGWAAAAWMVTSALGYGICCWLILRTCRNLRSDRATILILAASFPGCFYMVASGQNSVLAAVAFTAAFLCFRARLPLLAGMALGGLMYKPQFGVMAAVIFILSFEWKVILGALITGGGQLILGALYYGRNSVGTYVHSLAAIGRNASALEPHLDRMHCLRSFWLLLLPWHGAAVFFYLITSAAVIAVTWSCWRSGESLAIRYALFLVGSALIDPHLTDYDLVMLMPALLLIGEELLLRGQSTSRDLARVLTYGAYCLPLFGPMLKPLHLQLSVPAYACLFLVLAAVIRQDQALVAHSNIASAAPPEPVRP